MSELLDVQELKEHIRVNSKSDIVTCLSQLRNEPLRCKDFTKNGGLSILVELLRSSNRAIINMCLSILANACISSDAREKVQGSNIGDNIIHIMKNHTLDSKVHCRACRLVGNLSECKWHAEALYNGGVIEPLTTFLKLQTNRQTYLTAIRAIRNIWSFYEGSREKILQLQAVRLIAQLFVMAEDKKYTELMDVCLKAMCTFLVTQDKIADFVRCSAQMEADKDKQGYKALILCCIRGNNLAIKCLCNLCQSTGCRLVLGTLGVAELLITITRNGSAGDGELFRKVVVTLCLFCQESVHRMKMKTAGGLEVFVMLLKQPKFAKYHPILLDALTQFAYCDNSIVTLTKHGLLEVLMAKLTDSVADTTVMETSELSPISSSNGSNKRCYGSTPCRKYSRISEGRYSRYYTMHRFDGDSSPGSSTSVSSSPPSTPPLLYYDFKMETDNGDDNYSPVYSDTEWGDDEEPDEEADSLKSCKSLTIDADNLRDSEKAIKGVLCASTALLLLYRVSLLPQPIYRLADPMTIKSLLIYISRTKNEKAITILIRIVRNAAYFMPLLKQGFVFDVQGVPEWGEYIFHLRKVAETGGAFGQLSSVLLRGEERHKLLFAVSIPFLIVHSRITLKSLLHNHGGLQMILRLLSEPSHELHERAIWSICRLAAALQIRPEAVDKSGPATVASSVLFLREYPRESSHPQPSPTVTFELDDGTTVDACRRVLCQRSDAFRAMLEGNFSESGKRRVRLRNASRDGLNTLILAASGIPYTHRSIESLLDAVLLADKFLMPDLSDALTDSSVAKLSHENFSRAWWWAKTNACHELRSCCVKTFLTASMTNGQTVQAFRDFSATAAFDEFLAEIREIIMDLLCQP
ncbi:PREDICTED: armadillo repeat-containing protein 5-like [Dinoponera quadriceps]|uniref:Armadillo repeat-containing protein 5-like n=1 Tax=Dinoponera quadriceps TaxID=609295 RepID=A0A6P3YD62_DINQU|nr:PREDICTED: armadillo repeat-containing protein 5-like [Dinoponera quadriceps]